MISQDCQSGSIGQSSPGGPSIKVVSFFCMLSFVVVFRLTLFVICRCCSYVYGCFSFVCHLSLIVAVCPGGPRGPGSQVVKVVPVVQVVLVVRVAWVVRVVLVIKFVNAYGLHRLNNQIIEKT